MSENTIIPKLKSRDDISEISLRWTRGHSVELRVDFKDGDHFGMDVALNIKALQRLMNRDFDD